MGPMHELTRSTAMLYFVIFSLENYIKLNIMEKKILEKRFFI